MHIILISIGTRCAIWRTILLDNIITTFIFRKIISRTLIRSSTSKRIKIRISITIHSYLWRSQQILIGWFCPKMFQQTISLVSLIIIDNSRNSLLWLRISIIPNLTICTCQLHIMHILCCIIHRTGKLCIHCIQNNIHCFLVVTMPQT